MLGKVPVSRVAAIKYKYICSDMPSRPAATSNRPTGQQAKRYLPRERCVCARMEGTFRLRKEAQTSSWPWLLQKHTAQYNEVPGLGASR